MPGIFKKLSANDIKITPFEAHKRYSNTDLSSLGASADFVAWAPFNKAYYTQGNIKYSQLNKLYYRDYINSRANRLELDDATYTTQERRLYSYANVISLSQKTFGSEVQPGSFIVSCSWMGTNQYYIKDDSFGNLYDVNKGRTNFPNEDNRVLYLSPVQGFKRYDLDIDYETGDLYTNPEYPEGYVRTVCDDSYFQNPVEFKNINFIPSSESGFFSMTPSIESGSIKIPHQPHFNFEKNDDFTITLYYDIGTADQNVLEDTLVERTYTLLSKEGTKTVPPTPSDTTQYIPLNTTGSSDLTTEYAGPQYPYKIYLKSYFGDSTIFFERFDGENTQIVSSSFARRYSRPVTGAIFISCKNDNGTLSIQTHGQRYFLGGEQFLVENDSATQGSKRLEKHCSNKADINVFGELNNNNELVKSLGNQGSHIRQLMIWNKALSSEEIVNVSESIIGTPNIGNIFYDNGFAVITHPQYNNVLRDLDLSTITLEHSSSLDTQFISNIRFSSDGGKLIALDRSPNHGIASSSLYVYDLSTPYDISTLEYLKRTDFIDLGEGFRAFEFSPDGKKMFLLSNTANFESIHEFSLSSSYDPGSRSFIRKSSLDSVPNYYSLNFSTDGRKLFMLASNPQQDIAEYKLKTPFNISHLTFVENYDLNKIISPETVPLGLLHSTWSEDGYKLFVVGNSADQIKVLETPIPYNVKYIKSVGDEVQLKTPITPEAITIADNKLYIINTSGDDEIIQYDIKPNGSIKQFEYKNTHLITENEYQCTMTEDEFEFTRNISTLKIPFSDSEDIANFATGSNFKPYVTSVGLYDDEGNLLVVGKLGQPIKASSETDTTFVIRFDT